jgi:hypothetical protein
VVQWIWGTFDELSLRSFQETSLMNRLNKQLFVTSI